jgi:hypothetical protein
VRPTLPFLAGTPGGLMNVIDRFGRLAFQYLRRLLD